MIKFTNDFMYKYNINMLRDKIKQSICNHLINGTYLEMARKMVNDFSTKKEYYQSQVGCVSYLNIKQNKAPKEKLYQCLSSQFYSKMSIKMSKNLKHDNNSVIALILFYNKRKLLILKVLGVVVY